MGGARPAGDWKRREDAPAVRPYLGNPPSVVVIVIVIVIVIGWVG
jgi:hypothetical protein